MTPSRRRCGAVEEVKASVINTAGHDLKDASGKLFAPQRVGSGRIDAKAALDNQVLAYVQDDPGSVSVSFPAVQAGAPVSLTKTVKVVNKGIKPAEFTAAYEGIDNLPGVRFQLSTGSLKLSPRGVAAVKVTLKIIDPTALRKVMDPTVSSISTPGSVAFPGDQAQAVLNLTGKGIDKASAASATNWPDSACSSQGPAPPAKEQGEPGNALLAFGLPPGATGRISAATRFRSSISTPPGTGNRISRRT